MRLLFAFCLTFFYSCSGILKTAHTDNVKAFARSAKIMSGVPGRLYEEMAVYRHDLKMVEVSTIHNPEKLVVELNKIAALNRRFQANAVQISSTTALIAAYAECLLALTDVAYEKQWATQSDQLSLQLNTAFTSYNNVFNKRLPPNLGGFISGVVTEIGSVKLRRLQKKYLKSFVDTGAVIINDVCDYYTANVAVELANEISSLDKQFSNVLTHFYDEIYEYQKQQNINPFDYLKQYNPLYMEMKGKLDDLHLLQSQTVEAMKRLKAAHQSLQSLVDVKQPVGLMAEIKELFTIADEINAAQKRSVKK